VDKCQYKKSKFKPEAGNRKDLKSHVVSILHQNVQSLSNKLLELPVLLEFDLEKFMFCVLQNTGKRNSKQNS
jgi:hypothetical protein